MRNFAPYAALDKGIQANLKLLADQDTSVKVYAQAFESLGKHLADQINHSLNGDEHVLVAASSEDADWLMKGIWDNIKTEHAKLAVFWNLRANPLDDQRFAIAPVVKSYIEEIEHCDVLIICKSIIYTACVVRTNLSYLLEKVKPKRIIIASPVMFQGADRALRQEFPQFGQRFEFHYFAIDDAVNSRNEVEPGIGGSIYQRLGLGDSTSKNKYIPEIVKSRRQALYK